MSNRLCRTQQVRPGSLVKLTFLDFSTGAPHPLSIKPTVRLPSNTVVDVAYAEAEILGDYVLTTVMSGRDVCCFYLVSWTSGVVTLVSSFFFPSDASVVYVFFFFRLAPVAPRYRTIKSVETVMGAETREHRWRLDNAGELHQEQSRDLQARVFPSRTATFVYRVLRRVASIRTVRFRRRVQNRERVGSDILMVRNPIPTTTAAAATPTGTRRSLPLLQSGHDRPPPRT